MKHVMVFVVLGLSIYFLAIKKSDIDLLMVPVANYSEAQAGNRFADVMPSQLPITPKLLAEVGVVTVVYFHDENCSGCLQLDRNIADFLVVRPDVAVRKVSMSPGKNGYSDAIRDYQWKIYMAPCILIFDKNRKLIAADEKTNATGQDLLEKWMARELDHSANKKI
ncbi:hypothetical protein [Undibacterium parvum]|uniref:Thioredoxin domain-containing protein n=1 Tax=Undibacterium parvum TaxID=401471 RepID=A0A3Q9BVA8_9BURK|nr:hypothetical protein [Undibacterium parvum]AZP14109.1 hypothetical protein EJN92_20160 [Undibacterium parvum]